MNTGVFHTRVPVLILSSKTLKSKLGLLKEKMNRHIKRMNTSVSYSTEKLV